MHSSKFKSHLMADDAQKLIALGRANATPIPLDKINIELSV